MLFPSGTRSTQTIRIDITAQEFIPALRDGVRINPKKLSDMGIATFSELHGFHAGIKPTLSLVQQAEKQKK